MLLSLAFPALLFAQTATPVPAVKAAVNVKPPAPIAAEQKSEYHQNEAAKLRIVIRVQELYRQIKLLETEFEKLRNSVETRLQEWKRAAPPGYDLDPETLIWTHQPDPAKADKPPAKPPE